MVIVIYIGKNFLNCTLRQCRIPLTYKFLTVVLKTDNNSSNVLVILRKIFELVSYTIAYTKILCYLTNMKKQPTIWSSWYWNKP